MKKFFITSLLILLTLFGFAQKKDKNITNFLKTVKVNEWRTSFDFTPEWQYVSSDLYLFNTQKFSDVINSIIIGKKMRWWRRKRYDLQNILITMNLQGLGQYDKITFPLFNFVIQRDQQTGAYKVTSQSNEVIRIVDNYPAPKIQDFISAKVDVKVITKDNQVKIYKLAADQLQTISDIVTNPSGAIVKIVGEFGKMIDAVADSKEFHFSSTIRIYNNENFNQRLHSIVIFAFVPSTENEFQVNVDLTKLKKYLQKNPNPNIDRKFLYNYIRIKKYPYVVIVNYKSKYIPDVPEDIDFDVLKARENKLITDYKKGAIRPEIYELEQDLLTYLKKYAQFQLDLNNYFLNLKNQTTDDYSKFYYFIYKDYLDLKNTYKNTLTLRASNQFFQSDFKPYYDKFLKKAQIALEQNINLQNVRQLTDLVFKLENTPTAQIPTDSATIEKYLGIINSVKLPASEQNTPEVQLVTKWKNYLEQIFYQKEFKNDLERLRLLPVNDQTYQQVMNYQANHNSTNCMLCKKEMNDFVKDFVKKYQQYKLEQAKTNFENVQTDAKVQLIGITKKLSCIKQYLAKYQGSKPAYLQLIAQDVVGLDGKKQTLLAILNRNYVFTSADEITKVTQQIQDLVQSLTKDLNAICAQEALLCDCQKQQEFFAQQAVKQDSTKAVKQANSTKVTTSRRDSSLVITDSTKIARPLQDSLQQTADSLSTIIKQDTVKIDTLQRIQKKEGAEAEPKR